VKVTIDQMKILIADNTKVADIQLEFNHLFPFLKLEFYASDDDFLQPSSKKILNGNDKTVGQSRKGHESGIITIFPEMSVGDLEDIFRYSFGLSVQVLRKSGSLWLQTAHTDTWSLEEQNRQGELVSAHLRKQEERRSGQ
jgi:hypothetical protein